jgi:membrane peptidoglycan carboxypeptidase
VSNPSSRGYGQEPAREGRRSARSARSREDGYGDADYGRGAGYGRAASGRSEGYGREADNGRGAGYGRAASGRSEGYGRRSGNGSPDGYGRADGYRRADGNGRGDGYGRGDGNGYRPGNGSRAGDGNGRNGRPGGHRAGQGYRPREGHRFSNFGRGASDGEDARYGPGATGRRRVSQLGTDLRARLGLRSGGFDDYSDDGDDGYDGYGEPAGYRGYRNGDGARGATGLRERFTETTRGWRRAGGGSGDGRDGGQRVRRKGDWWRRWTWKKALFVVLGTGAGLVVLVILGLVYEYQKTPIPTDVSELALQQSSTVYFSNGKTEIGTFSANGVYRQLLNSNQIPVVMKNAMVAAEDRNFYNEGGISTTGILRAAYTDLRGGDYAQGGSTLTQQFVRNYYSSIGTEQTLSRKLKEIFVAIKLSHEKSKDWILTQYLNTVPFGDNAYGVAAASETYFGEPALKLTVSQAAMLAAMPNQPSFFDPNPSAGAGYTALVSRWQYVLGNMVRDGVLTQAEESAQKFPKVIPNNNVIASGWTGYKGYIMLAVQSEMHNLYGYTPTQLDGDGLKIVTTINVQYMNDLQNAVISQEQQMRDDGTALPWYAHVGAVLEQPGGAILAFYGGPGLGMSPAECQKLLCYDNTAFQDREQVGSSFKPYVLATAVSEGMNVQNSVLDAIEPMCIPPDSTVADRLTLSTVSTNCPTGWFPVNIQGENGGAMTVTNAAAQSSDPAFEDLIHHAGTQQTVTMAQQFGVDTAASGLQAKVGEVGLALGIASLTVEEQATTFATLDNGGEYVTPHLVAQITKSDGSSIPLKLVHRSVLNATMAADVDAALSQDTVNGTGFPGGVLNPTRPTIGKTGTTDQAESAFFLGAIPNYSLAVGVFTNEQDSKPPDQCGSAGVNSPKPCGQTLNILPAINNQSTGGFGGAWPIAIWHTFMQNEFGNTPVLPLPTPDYAGFSKWDQVQGTPKPPKKNNPSQGGQGQCPPGQQRSPGGCPSPSPSPTPTPTVTVSPTPTPTPTRSRRPGT